MEKHNLLLALCLFIFSLLHVSRGAEAAQQQKNHRDLYGFHPTKLFVFGDSYADTGNTRKTLASSWKVPYGTTFPGKPSGRYSDGRVLTDYLARYLGLKTPIAYRWRSYAPERLKYGMNFAYGGTGVFDTLVSYPNMTTQIDFFQNRVYESLYSKSDLKSSLILVALSGNDYSTYLAKGGTAQGLPSFISLVVNQLAVNLNRIGKMGVGRIAVAALQPLGCLPQSTIQNSFQQCNTTDNTAVNLHNLLLQQAVEKLNNETKGSPFVILDLYDSFLKVLENKGYSPSGAKFETPFKPCCIGINTNYSCGSIDQNGNKLYNVCGNPGEAFFWDSVHPTQAGWREIYLSLKSNLELVIS